MINEKQQFTCPYCLKDILEESRDHIFSNFLGGKRRILVCSPCNSIIGRTFEAEASKTLKNLHVFICALGLRLESAMPLWKKAHLVDGNFYDLTVGKESVLITPSHPVLETYEDGTIKKAMYRTENEAEKVIEKLKIRGKATETIALHKTSEGSMPIDALKCTVTVEKDLKRLALKMSMALCTTFDDFDVDDISEARMYMTGDDKLVHVNNVLLAPEYYDEIDALRPPLSHTIYVEKNETLVYSIVQFFGSIQLYCHLGKAKPDSKEQALFGFLDPVGGEESFAETNPLYLERPKFIRADDFPKAYASYVERLSDQAGKRGASKAGNLRVS